MKLMQNFRILELSRSTRDLHSVSVSLTLLQRLLILLYSIGDSDEPLGRMLGVLRFWFTKDLVCRAEQGSSELQGAHGMHRNTSKGNRVNPTTPHLESSFG